MKLTTSVMLGILVLSCSSAFGQSVNLGFLDHDKKTQYCDYVQITIEKPPVVTGNHLIDQTPPCFATPGVIAGVKATVPATSALAVTGTVATFADNTYDNQQGYMGACQCSEFYVMKLRPSTSTEIQSNIYGWALYTNFGGTATLQQFGFTTKQLGNNGDNQKDTFDFVF